MRWCSIFQIILFAEGQEKCNFLYKNHILVALLENIIYSEFQ